MRITEEQIKSNYEIINKTSNALGMNGKDDEFSDGGKTQ